MAKRWVVVHTTEMLFRIIHLQVFPQSEHTPLCLMMGPSQNRVPEWAGSFSSTITWWRRNDVWVSSSVLYANEKFVGWCDWLKLYALVERQAKYVIPFCHDWSTKFANILGLGDNDHDGSICLFRLLGFRTCGCPETWIRILQPPRRGVIPFWLASAGPQPRHAFLCAA